MLISVRSLTKIWGLKPKTIVHVGAHLAEEYADYVSYGWGQSKVLWIEGDPQLVPNLTQIVKGSPHHKVINAMVWSETGLKKKFYRANFTQSSSLLELDRHAFHYPGIWVEEITEQQTTSLADIFAGESVTDVDFLNLDIQGAELEALKGLGRRLESVAVIYSEVNVESIYAGNGLIAEMDSYLLSFGFVRVDSRVLKAGWGDALWIRSGRVPPFPKFRRRLRALFGFGKRVAGAPARVLRRSSLLRSTVSALRGRAFPPKPSGE